MTNHTMEWLERSVFIYERSRLLQDPEYECRELKYETLREEFIRRHRGNRELILELNNILDERSALAEYHARFRLFFGLQMGMELREFRLMPDEQELQCFTYITATGALREK